MLHVVFVDLLCKRTSSSHCIDQPCTLMCCFKQGKSLAELCNGWCPSSAVAGARHYDWDTQRGHRGNGPGQDGGATMCLGRASSQLRARIYGTGDAMTSAKKDSPTLSGEVADPTSSGLSTVVCRRPQDGCLAIMGGRLSSAARAAIRARESFRLLMGPERKGPRPELWWMLRVGSRQCGVKVVRLAPQHVQAILGFAGDFRQLLRPHLHLAVRAVTFH